MPGRPRAAHSAQAARLADLVGALWHSACIGVARWNTPDTDEYLRCGILERACLHLVCQSCGHSELVALSCKKRGFCPSCIGRRMADTSVHLEQHVLPAIPIRHWICSLPWDLRSLLGYDKRLCAGVVPSYTTASTA